MSSVYSMGRRVLRPRPTGVFMFLCVGIIGLAATIWRESIPFPAEWSSERLYDFMNDVGIPGKDQTFGCDRCLVDKEICERFGTHNVDLSRAFDGSGARVQRLLRRAMAGEPIVTGVLGGSVSRGHACACTPWHSQVFQYLNETFPHPESRHIFGAVGARGSDYFKFCHHNHMDDDVDLIMVEMAVNDIFPNDAAFHDFETLIRSLLNYPKKPAIIVLQPMQLQEHLATGGDFQLSACGFYDIPCINVRNWLAPRFMSHYETAQHWFNWNFTRYGEVVVGGDKLHPHGTGHAYMADMIKLYLAQQLCYIKRQRPIVPPSQQHPTIAQESDYDMDIVPRVRMNMELREDNVSPDVTPKCESVDSEKAPLVPVADQTHGWAMWQQSEEKKYWRAITFEVTLATGEITIYYLRSKTMGLGAVECWLDNDKSKTTKVDAYWDKVENIGQPQALFNKQTIDPGKHMLHCEVIDSSQNPDKDNRSTFLFIGVFAV